MRKWPSRNFLAVMPALVAGTHAVVRDCASRKYSALSVTAMQHHRVDTREQARA